MTQAAENLKKKCTDLRDFWQPRDAKFKEWYELIQMIDQLKQDKMESFVTNEPRAAFNLVRHMLDIDIPHRIYSEDLNRELLGSASELEEIYKVGWRDIYNVHRQRGREGFLHDFIGFLLATGWYSVFAQLSSDGKRFEVELWNPATVFQNWDDVLVEVAHVFPLTAKQANAMLKRNNWKVPQKITTDTWGYDYWWWDGKFVWNSVAIGNDIVKPDTRETRFKKRIPIFTGPSGGLPDTGIITTNDVWKGELGQTSLATNEYMIQQTNKWWSFMMQLLRDTAQPMTYEKAAGGAVILKPADKFKRGVHVKMGPQDDLGYIVPPAIPMELRSMQLDMEAQSQKGAPANALYGATTQQLTSFVMSQIAASAQMIAKPFHRAVIHCLSDIDNFIFDMGKSSGAKPYGLEFPDDLPDNIQMTASYELRVPGDAATRATYSRMLNPEFELSQRRVMEEFWPEISNPMEEAARVRAEKALNHPSHAVINLIQSYRESSKSAEAAGDLELARLYDKAAEVTEQQMFGQAPEEAQGGGRQEIGTAPQNIPGVPQNRGEPR